MLRLAAHLKLTCDDKTVLWILRIAQFELDLELPTQEKLVAVEAKELRDPILVEFLTAIQESLVLDLSILNRALEKLDRLQARQPELDAIDLKALLSGGPIVIGSRTEKALGRRGSRFDQ